MSTENLPGMDPGHSAGLASQALRAASRFGATPAQARALYLRNAAGSRQMAEKAERTGGRKVGGYTSDELRRHEAEAMALACALDHSI